MTDGFPTRDPIADAGTLVTIEAEKLAELERIREAAERWDAACRKFWESQRDGSRAEVVRAEQALRAALRG